MIIPKIVKWYWTFFDGNTSTERNPTHVYQYMAGSYDVTLTVTDEFGNTYTVTVENAVTVYDYDYKKGGINASITDKCYRLPCSAAQGFGPSEYADGEHPGFDWVWPCGGGVGAMRCYDSNKQEIALVCDTKTQSIYQINNIEAIDDREGVNDYGVSGRVVSEIHQKEVFAQQGEHAAIRHNETHLYFKPQDREKRFVISQDEEWDAVGFRANMRVDVLLHKNGEPLDPVLKTVKVPQDGDLVFQEQIEARTLQHRIKIYAGGWWLTAKNEEFETIDKAARPNLRQMTESIYQENISTMPLFRVSRHNLPKMNLATGKEATGTVGLLVTGPDGRDYSAISFNNIPYGLSDTLPENLDNDFTFMIWVKNIFSLPLYLMRCGTLIISIQPSYVLNFNDTVNNFNDTMNYAGGDWTLVTVIRQGGYLNIYENKTFKRQYSLLSMPDYGTTFSCATNTPSTDFDITLLNKAVTAEEIEYYYDDVLKGGNQVLPLF